MSAVDADPQPAPRQRRSLGTNYWKLFTSSTLTNLGDGLMAVAVVWLASSLTRDALVIALVGLASRVPWLLFSLPAGVIADRFDRRRLIVAMDLSRVVVIALFAIPVALLQSDLPTPEELAVGAAPPDSATLLLWALALAALLLGFAEVVRDNAAQTLMPSVVPRNQLERANGRLWGAEMTMNNFVGPPLGGVIIAAALVLPFVINAGLLAVGAALIFALTGTFLPKGQQNTGRISWRTELTEGFGWLWRHRLLRTLALLLGALNFLSAVSGVIMILYVQEILGLFEGWQFGLLITGMAAGAVLASFAGGRVAEWLPPGTILIASIIAMGLTSLVIGLTSHAIVAWLAMAVGGAFGVLWNVVTVSLRQRIIPDHLLGRVNSVYRFFGWGTISIGTLVGGVIVTVVEPWWDREWALRSPFLLAGGLTLALLLVAVTRVTTAQIRAAQDAAEAGETPTPAPSAEDH